MAAKATMAPRLLAIPRRRGSQVAEMDVEIGSAARATTA
jgi:hypothetical protein